MRTLFFWLAFFQISFGADLDAFRTSDVRWPDAMASTSFSGALQDSENVESVLHKGIGLYAYVFKNELPQKTYTITFLSEDGRELRGRVLLQNEYGFVVEFVSPLTDFPRDVTHKMVIYAVRAHPKTVTP